MLVKLDILIFLSFCCCFLLCEAIIYSCFLGIALLLNCTLSETKLFDCKLLLLNRTTQTKLQIEKSGCIRSKEKDRNGIRGGGAGVAGGGGGGERAEGDVEGLVEGYICHQHSPCLFWQGVNLVADIGGQLGLWIGISVLTCCEFVELVGMIMQTVFDRISRRNRIIHVHP